MQLHYIFLIFPYGYTPVIRPIRLASDPTGDEGDIVSRSIVCTRDGKSVRRLGGKPGDPGDPDRNQGGKPDLVGGGGSLPIFLGVLDSSFW